MSNLEKMFSIFCYSLFFITLKTVESSTQPSNKILKFRDMYYVFSQNGSTWAEAFQECIAMGGLLVTPSNPVLDDSIRMFMIGSEIKEKVWTGGRVSWPDAEGRRVWFWETFNFDFLWTNFHSRACETLEENSCLLAYTQNGYWGWCGVPCNDKYHYICEFGALSTTTSTTEAETSTTIGDTTTTQVSTVTTTEIVSTTTVPSFLCPFPYGSFADPKDCARYYVCEYGVVIAHHRCPFPLLWNDPLKTCDYSWHVECELIPTTTAPIISTTSEATTVIHTTIETTPPPTDFICPAPEGSFSDPKDCTKYYVCSHGHVIAHKKCPNNKLWNNVAKKCDDPWNVDCYIA